MSHRTIVLLGPQRLAPTLDLAVSELGIHGRIAAVTAGWEEREAEDQELSDHLGGRIVNLAVYHRVEEIFQRDPELLAGMLARHAETDRLRALYRLQLAHALDAARTLLAMNDKDDPEPWEEGLLEPECTAAIEAVHRLDEHHLARVAQVHARFEAEFRLAERPQVALHRAELGKILQGTSALCLAGGHVGILLNRLKVLDVLELCGNQPLFAWSAGAMAAAERVVLFHDSPPQGPGDAEVLEAGLGIAPGVVPLPHAKRRLRLDDPARVALFARRFGPALCPLLDEGTRLDLTEDGWRASPGTMRLSESGLLEHACPRSEAETS